MWCTATLTSNRFVSEFFEASSNEKKKENKSSEQTSERQKFAGKYLPSHSSQDREGHSSSLGHIVGTTLRYMESMQVNRGVRQCLGRPRPCEWRHRGALYSRTSCINNVVIRMNEQYYPSCNHEPAIHPPDQMACLLCLLSGTTSLDLFVWASLIHLSRRKLILVISIIFDTATCILRDRADSFGSLCVYHRVEGRPIRSINCPWSLSLFHPLALPALPHYVSILLQFSRSFSRSPKGEAGRRLQRPPQAPRTKIHSS